MKLKALIAAGMILMGSAALAATQTGECCAEGAECCKEGAECCDDARESRDKAND